MSDTDQKPVAEEAVNGGGTSVPPSAEGPRGSSSDPPAEPEGAKTEGAEPEAQAKAELEKALAEAARYKDQLLRTAADFDNFRKRTRKELEDAQRKGLERALLELLPVTDNLERAIQASQNATDIQSIVEGVRMVLRFNMDALARLGVERIESLNKPFDPALHEAVSQVPSDQPVGTVVGEMVPGYRLGNKLLRAAVVAVAGPPAPASSEGEKTDEQSADAESADGQGADGAKGVAEPPQN